MKNRNEIRNIAASLSDEIVSVKCSFNRSSNGGKFYTYLAPKKLAEHLEPNDIVICTRDGANGINFAVARVVEIDEDCDIDPSSSVEHQFIFQVVNKDRADQMVAWLDNAADKLYKMQKAAQRRRLLESWAEAEQLEGVKGAIGSLEQPTEKPKQESKKSLLDEFNDPTGDDKPSEWVDPDEARAFSGIEKWT